jgi:hypothetical protein
MHQRDDGEQRAEPAASNRLAAFVTLAGRGAP